MIPLSDFDFALLRDYLRGTAGLEFDETRRTSLSAVMTERLRMSGRPDVSAYVRFIDRPDGAAERQHLLDDVTIQETHFHRARPQIDALRDHLLPSVLAAAAREGRGVTVWSAGCSHRRGAVHVGHARPRGPRTDGGHRRGAAPDPRRRHRCLHRCARRRPGRSLRGSYGRPRGAGRGDPLAAARRRRRPRGPRRGPRAWSSSPTTTS